jgi:hypothetical protein
MWMGARGIGLAIETEDSMVPGDGHKVQNNIRFHVQEIGPQHCDEPLNSVDISTPNSSSAKQMLKWVGSHSIEALRSLRSPKEHKLRIK